MRKILGIFVAISIFSCQEDKTANNTTGTIQGVEDGTQIFVISLGENNQPIPVDTAVVKNESFTLDLPKAETPTLNSLRIENIRGNMVFINENEPLTMEVYKDSVRASVVSGGKNNTLLYDYSQSMKEFGEKMNNLNNQFMDPANRQNPTAMKDFQQKQEDLKNANATYRKELVENNPNSLVAVLALSDLVNMKSLTTAEIKTLYDGLSDNLKTSPMGKSIESQLQVASVTAVGSKAPQFSGPTPTGETLALKDAMGKVTLVDFWASWCKPCRKENPNIVRIYKKYHDKGLNIVGVSLDKSKEKWLQAIEADQLTWNHISNLKFWQDPIAQMYNVRSIPAAFLLDENGMIVGKDLRGQALEDKIAEFLGAVE